MSQNVGEIDLGLDINQRQFNNQLSGIASSAKKSATTIFGGFGKTIGKVLGVTAVVGFTKSCLNLGSNLSEVQNVVDVTFGKMAGDVNKFASTAIEQFGLSETAAKRYTGTMGAMLKSSGITTSKALEMSKAITGLSADMASFYNLKNEEAFEKIRSGISGETEPLKQLGINMSVANLEAYRMAEGISTAYSKMSQQEQTLLRYNYLLSVTKDAQGDFARTSDSWANQVRILSEQFNALKASIGQGLIAAFTPIVKGLNFIIGKLRVAAGYFKAFMELIFGKQASSGGSGMASVADDTSAIGDAANDASDAVGGIGDAADDAGKKAKKAGKNAKGALASFDELNQLNISDSSGSDGSGSGSGLDDMGGAVDVDFGSVEEGASKLSSLFDGMLDQLKHLKDLFAEGFKAGLGDDINDRIANIKDSLKGIKDSLIDIFTDSKVVDAAKNYLDAFALNAGKILGSFASIGVTIAQNLLGGINKYLDQNKQFIKDSIVDMFNVGADILNLLGDFAVTFADIFSTFGSDSAQQVTANIIGVFANAFLGATRLALKFGRDIIMCITKPIEENKDAIKEAFLHTFDFLATFTGTIQQMVTDIFSKANEVYDQYLQPAFTNIKDGISNVLGAIFDNYNKYVAPLLQSWADDFNALYQEHLKPMFDKILEVVGKLVECISVIWENVLAPLISWLLSVAVPEICGVLDIVWGAVKNVAAWLADIIKGVMTTLGGLLDFLTGVFTLDWKKAWDGITEIVKGIGQTAYDFLVGGLGKILSWLKDSFITAFWASRDSIMNAFKPLTTWFDTNVIQPVSKAFTNLWNTIKTKASEAWKNICSIWQTANTWFNNTVVEPVKTTFTNWGNAIKQIGTTAWEGLKSSWQGACNWFKSTIVTPVQNAFSNMWSNIANKCSGAFDTIKNSARNGINGLIGFLNKFISGINSNLSFNMPEALGGAHVGFSIPQVPMLARGGIVDQPTLAMVGEAGKEAVVPLENNMEWVQKMASSIASALLPFIQGTSGGDNRDIVVNVGDVELVRAFLPALVKEAKRQGVDFNA